jgi:flagellar basal body-associated protein FliL
MVRLSPKRASLALALALILPLHIAAAAEEAKDEGPTDVDMPPILAPIVVENRLESYAYITIQLTPASRDKALVIREKVPFLRDGFLREVNSKAGIGKAGDPRTVDQPALKKRLLARVNQILPPGTVSDLKFGEIVLTAIQPQS